MTEATRGQNLASKSTDPRARPASLLGSSSDSLESQRDRMTLYDLRIFTEAGNYSEHMTRAGEIAWG